jgi:hypothetical protein
LFRDNSNAGELSDVVAPSLPAEQEIAPLKCHLHCQLKNVRQLNVEVLRKGTREGGKETSH